MIKLSEVDRVNILLLLLQIILSLGICTPSVISVLIYSPSNWLLATLGSVLKILGFLLARRINASYKC